MKQQDREAYNSMNTARRMLMQEAVEEQRRYGKTPRYKSLILGCGALCEILDNIDRNHGKFIQVSLEKPEVSKWRAVISRLMTTTKPEESGDA